MTAEILLSRLDRVRRTGTDRWVARCPAHADSSPSLSIRELSDGRVLLHDFGGCGPQQILEAVGLEFDALFPNGADRRERRPRERRPFSPDDALRLVDCEIQRAAILIAVCAKHGLTPEQRTRLMQAAATIRQARMACGLREAQF